MVGRRHASFGNLKPGPGRFSYRRTRPVVRRGRSGLRQSGPPASLSRCRLSQHFCFEKHFSWHQFKLYPLHVTAAEGHQPEPGDEGRVQQAFRNGFTGSHERDDVLNSLLCEQLPWSEVHSTEKFSKMNEISSRKTFEVFLEAIKWCCW